MPRLIPAVLIATLFLQSCSIFYEPYAPSSTGDGVERLESAGLKAKGANGKPDPSQVFSAKDNQEKLNKTDKIVPLIESVSITLYGFTQYAQNSVSYRRLNEQTWHKAHALQWEPVNGAMSGSIVYLEPSTAYQVRVEYPKDAATIEKTFDFTTQPNSPPIDPNKIYYLSDIYSGGALDLAELNIQGKPGAWAKIVGDGVIIEASEHDIALDLAGKSYIMLDNVSIRGAKKFGIYSRLGSHIWINGCDISKFGRTPVSMHKGRAYADQQGKELINYDSGIFLSRTGSVVVEECDIHTPNYGANNWGSGHPAGASAMLVQAGNNSASEGQYIIRNNRFYGSDTVRFNDVIESRSNVRRNGGFVRDSAIYNNYLAYANDDLIELDGGQSNVLVYNNYITQGYCGISVAPNMLGPSYIFNNTIEQLGDDRDKEWAAIKMGGLYAAPSGKTLVFQNYINVKAHGIASARLRGDSTYWTETRNNIIVLSQYRKGRRGYGVRDVESFYLNQHVNDFVFNTAINRASYLSNNSVQQYSYVAEELNKLLSHNLDTLDIEDKYYLYNFSKRPFVPVDDDQPAHASTSNTYNKAFKAKVRIGSSILNKSQ